MTNLGHDIDLSMGVRHFLSKSGTTFFFLIGHDIFVAVFFFQNFAKDVYLAVAVLVVEFSSIFLNGVCMCVPL